MSMATSNATSISIGMKRNKDVNMTPATASKNCHHKRQKPFHATFKCKDTVEAIRDELINTLKCQSLILRAEINETLSVKTIIMDTHNPEIPDYESTP